MSDRTAEHSFSPVDLFLPVRQLPCPVHAQIRIRAELCVHPQIFEIGLCDQLTHCIWHASDTQLQCSAVHNIGQDVLCDLSVDLGRPERFQDRERFMFPLHDIIHI